MDNSNMTSDSFSGQPEPKNNTTMIIIIVIVVLLCCCCLIIGGAGASWMWQNGDQFMPPTSLLTNLL